MPSPPHNNPTATPPAPTVDPQAPGRTRVLVTGSRTWTDTTTIHTALNALHTQHRAGLVVLHGACPRGADAITDAWCTRHRVPVERYPANWRRLGTRAGHARNAAMVATGPARCLAFIRDRSPGATGCAALAEAAGIPTTHHTAPSRPPDRRASVDQMTRPAHTTAATREARRG
ncbi:MAG TPA: SLOG family protein [Micromonosporaceae bacterium]|nr:SLOG family protein [Micromonosporaceae bacterium]